MNKLLHYAGPEAIKEYTATLSSLVTKKQRLQDVCHAQV